MQACSLVHLKHGATLRRLLAACAIASTYAASAQFPASQVVNGSAPPPVATGVQAQDDHSDLDGKCRAAKPGDVVHFTLRVEGVAYARAVYANLQMSLGRVYVKDTSRLPPPDLNHLGGGGPAARDASQGNVYHFAFTVPRDVSSGMYHGSGVYVTAASSADSASEGSRNVDITAHTLKEVRRYCLIVVSPYGPQGRPLVTDFDGGAVERKVAQALPPQSPSSRIYLPTR
jgi:hypothetical protein